MIKKMVMKLTRGDGRSVLVNFDNVLYVENANDGEVGTIIRFNVARNSVYSASIRVKESLDEVLYKLTT